MLSIKIDVGDSMKALKKYENTPFASSWAINKAMVRTQRWAKSQMATKLGGGVTPFTRKMLQRVDSDYRAFNIYTRRKNSAVMFFDEKAFYMDEVVFGGNKRPRNRRLPEPMTKNIRLTKKGNIPRNFQQQVVLNQTASGFRRQDLMARGVLSRNSRKRFKNLWIGVPNGGGPLGIYKTPRNGGPPILMIRYNRKSRQQRSIWPAHEQIEKHFQRTIPIWVNRAWNKYLSPTSRGRAR